MIPMLSYEDIAGTADWLVAAFGFRETMRLTDDDGAAVHIELASDDGRVMLGTPGDTYRNPKHLREECEVVRRMYDVPYVVDGVHVYVDDVDTHCERARAAGATIVNEPQDSPYGRLYAAEDVEGHRWMFMQKEGD